jgi:aspartate aminotransferase-like enzyme
MIGHRGPEVRELLAATLPRVAGILGTAASVYPLACSATGAMEGAIRNLDAGPVLHLVCGAFGRRWSDLRRACGRSGDDLEVEWGRPIEPDAVARALDRRTYAAVTLVHNETSTGVLNPLPEIAAVVRERSDALLLVDTVSSMAATELELDRWGVDLCLAGVQKAWALPPGLTLVAVGPRALERSARAEAKGFYFDWVEHERRLQQGQTPSTPPLSLLFQLRRALDLMEEEGLPARYARHRSLRNRVLAWAAGRFAPFAAAGYRSPSLTALHAGEVDLEAWLARVRRRGFVVGAGYGKTRDAVFRVGHMGAVDLPLLEECLQVLDEERPPAVEGRR